MSAPARVACLALLAIGLLFGAAGAASGGEIRGSRLALRSPRAQGSALLAQRTITREWGFSEDTTYAEVDIPDYRSEGWAMLLSGAVPGVGQLYVGEASGYWFALAEAATWAAKWAFRQRADRQHDDALRYVGSPFDATSNWSFTRYFLATQGDTTALQQLFAGDRDAFYHRVGFDERYKLGWKSDPFVIRDAYQILEKSYQRSRKRERYATGAIILSHLVASLDALHAAREHNLPLQRNLRFKLKGSLEPEGPAMCVVVERWF